MLLGCAFVDLRRRRDQVLFFFKFVGNAADFRKEKHWKMIEQYFDGFALLVSQLPLIVNLQTVPVESQNPLDFLMEIVLKQIFHIPLQSFHENRIFNEDSGHQSLHMFVIWHQVRNDQQVITKQLGMGNHKRFLQFNRFWWVMFIFFTKSFAAVRKSSQIYVLQQRMR